MNKLDILTFPDPRLRKKAQPIERFDENLKDMAKKMLHTMYADKGIGLAATQVNYHERLIVIVLMLKLFFNPLYNFNFIVPI